MMICENYNCNYRIATLEGNYKCPCCGGQMIQYYEKYVIFGTDDLLFYIYQQRQIISNGDSKLNEHAGVANIYGSEGRIPHLHLRKLNEADCCVRLDISEFFVHGNHKRILNSKEIKIFKESMEKDNFSLFNAAMNLWNEKNPDYKITNLCPDYSKLLA